LTVRKFLISGSLSLSVKRSFQLSLTVLLHYRTMDIFRFNRWTYYIQTKFHVFCLTFRKIFNLAALIFSHTSFALSMSVYYLTVTHVRHFWAQNFFYTSKKILYFLLIYFDSAHHYSRNLFCFLFLWLTEMFHFAMFFPQFKIANATYKCERNLHITRRILSIINYLQKFCKLHTPFNYPTAKAIR